MLEFEIHLTVLMSLNVNVLLRFVEPVVIPETVREKEVIQAGVLPVYDPGLGSREVLMPIVPVAAALVLLDAPGCCA